MTINWDEKDVLAARHAINEADLPAKRTAALLEAVAAAYQQQLDYELSYLAAEMTEAA